MNFGRALTHYPFLLLWSGQSISRLGDQLYQMALTWYVLEQSGSAAAMSAVLTLAFLPKLLLLLIGGVVVDRFPRLPVMIASDVLRGLLMATLAWLAWHEQLTLWQIYMASMLFGLVAAFFEPAYTAILPEIAHEEMLPSANALNSISADSIGVIGPLVGAWIVQGSGVAIAFGLDALSFLLSAVCLGPLLRRSPSPIARPEPANWLVELRRGLQAVWATPWLRISLLILALVNLTGRSSMNVALPFLVRQQLQMDVNGLGVLYTSFALGSLVGAIVVGRQTKIPHRGRLIYSGMLLVGGFTIGLGVMHTLPGAIAMIVPMATTLTAFNLIWALLIQSRISPVLIGRVTSINLLSSNGLLPLGFVLAGWITTQFGPQITFVGGGLLTMLFALFALLQRDIWELK